MHDLLLLLAGCDILFPPADDDDSTEAPPAEVDPWVRTIEPQCATPTVTVDATDPTTFHSNHFLVSGPAGSEAETERITALLETALPGMTGVFGAEPEATVLTMWIEPDDAAFRARLTQEGVTAPTGISGWYEPGVGAFVTVQPNTWYTRVVAVHEAFHAVHDRFASLVDLPFWYKEGLADAVARHLWDGECVSLLQQPPLSYEDPAAGVSQDAGGSCLSCDVADSNFRDRATGQELMRFLLLDSSVRPAFDNWAAQVDAGVWSASDGDRWSTSFPDADAAFRAFVAEDQEPMRPAYAEWIPMAADSVWGTGPLENFAWVKGGAGSFEAEVDWDGLGEIGVLYGHDPATGDIELATVSAGGAVTVLSNLGGVGLFTDAGDVPALAVPGTVQISLTDLGAGASRITISGESVDLVRTLDAAAGPALFGATATFRAMTWAP